MGAGEGLAGEGEGGLMGGRGVARCDGGGAEGGGVAVGREGGGGVGAEGSGVLEEEDSRSNALRRSFKSPIGRLALPGDWGEGAGTGGGVGCETAGGAEVARCAGC